MRAPTRHFKTLPKLEDLISGQVTVNAIQEVSIEDLLGREKIELDRDMMQAGLSGKVIMVTGGGGSIGTGTLPAGCRLRAQCH